MDIADVVIDKFFSLLYMVLIFVVSILLVLLFQPLSISVFEAVLTVSYEVIKEEINNMNKNSKGFTPNCICVEMKNY